MKKRSVVADDLYKFIFLGDPQICPCGAKIAFTSKTISKKHKYETQICTLDLKSKAVKQWTHDDRGNRHARWSPNGQFIAFQSGRTKPFDQIYLLPTDGGEAHQLTRMPEGTIGEFKWSSDGSKLAMTFRETAEPFTEAAAKKREEEGGATPPVEIDTEWYRLDGDGYFGNQRFQLYLVDAISGKHKLLYKESALGDIEFNWHPKGTELVVTHMSGKHPLRKPGNAQIYRVPIKGSAKMVPDQPVGGKSPAKYSPDGKHIAYMANVDAEDSWGTRNDRLYVTSIDGGEPKCLTPDDIDFASATLGDVKEAGGEHCLFWAPDGKSLIVGFSRHGEEQLARVGLDGKVTELTKGAHVLIFGNLSTDGTCIPAVHHTLTTPGELVLVNTKSGAITDLTHENKELMDELAIAASEPVWINSTDGVKVHAWVIKPHDMKSGGKCPAVLEIHGGPHAQYGNTFFFEFQLLAAQGYVVVFSNPRGSKGYGEEFCRAIYRNWGEKDWQDVQAVRDWMKGQSFIDSKRMGVMGGSYGGYMTNWVIGHTHDFKAAITDRCVSNLVSMPGSSDYPLNPNGYFGGVAYGDLEEIRELWKQSPVAYFKGVNTPTLVIHSVGDLRCNIEQSEQIFYALQMQGVASRFVRYPVETSHGMSRSGPPDLRLHRLGEILAWWKKHL